MDKGSLSRTSTVDSIQEIQPETPKERAKRISKEKEIEQQLTTNSSKEVLKQRERKRDKLAKALHLRHQSPELVQNPRLLQLNQIKLSHLHESKEDMLAEVFSKKLAFASRKISKLLLESGPDRSLTEDEVDDMILKIVDPRGGFPIGKHTKRFKSYRNSFSGKDLVTWISNHYNWDRTKAIEKGQTILMNRQVFYNLSTLHKSLHDKRTQYYRFRLMDNVQNFQVLNDVKNSYDTMNDPVKLSEELAEMAINLLMIPHTEQDFSSIRRNKMFFKFWLKTCNLQRVQMNKMSNKEKLVFFVNLHNVLVVHNSILNDPPRSKLDLKQSLTKSYRISNFLYSLQLIRLIFSGSVPDESLLPNEDFQINQRNPMVHFCLITATDHSPTLRSYSLADFDEMATQQAKQYLTDHMETRREFSQVWIPRMLGEHYKEFANSPREMLEFLSPFMSRYNKDIIVNNLDEMDIKYKDSSFKNVRYIKESLKK